MHEISRGIPLPVGRPLVQHDLTSTTQNKGEQKMKTNRRMISSLVGCAMLASALLTARETRAVMLVVERYDFGTSTSPTQDGWAAVTFAQKYNGVSSGFDVGDLSFGSYNRDPSTWSAQASSFITQTNLQRDGIYGRNGPISLVWHDVLPD